MKDVFPTANTIVCIEESKLLKQFEYDILYDKKGLQETVEELNKINYFNTYHNATVENFNSMLDGLMEATFNLLKRITPVAYLCRLFTLEYDIHNMKLVVKERLMRQRLDHLSLSYGNYPMRTIRSAAVRESDDILENKILTTGLFQALQAESIYEVEFILDQTYFQALTEFAEFVGHRDIKSFVRLKVDLYNISAHFQELATGNQGYFEKVFSAYGNYSLKEREELLHAYRSIWNETTEQQKQLAQLDVWLDNYLIEKTKVAKLEAFGVVPICAYFFNKLMEIKNIRILLTGKAGAYPTDAIKKRMRIPYEL